MSTIWDKKRSYWYYRAIEESNYPRRAVAALAPLLKRCDSVLDIGAGCGALSIPVARRVHKVTSIEPSKWMYRLLLKRAEDNGIRNISAFNSGWERTGFRGSLQRGLQTHDLVLCANLPGTVICNIKFLRYIAQVAKKYVVYIQNAGGWNRFYYRELYPLLLKKKYSNICDYIETYKFLHRHGVLANVRFITYSLDQPFKDFAEALDFWRHRLKVRLTQEKMEKLKRFLEKQLIPLKTGVNVPEGSCTLLAPFGSRKSAVMWWKSW